eukprot:GFUD01108968.1.p1 GENE.GFUD01108968.1~~GFUD01108968.1.p1  ORF type:complete len:141 (-),score=73.50 GFUD01108968.1:96-518(-)
MASSLSSWLVPVLLTVGCVTLVMNILNAKKVNRSLVENIERAQADLRVAMDTSQDCTKQLEGKSAEMTAKDQVLASLTGNVNTLTDEKNQIQEQVNQLQQQIDQANSEKDAVVAENDKLTNELEAAKAPKKEAPKEEPPK